MLNGESMKRDNKTILWLTVFITLLITFCAVGTYAHYNFKQHYHGSFDVDINSKGVDVFTLHGSDDITLLADENNFAKKIGRNLTASATMDVRLETTNKNAGFCYELTVHLPEHEVFEYSAPGRAELLLNVKRTNQYGNVEYFISNLDITTKTGTIKIPVSNNSNDYLHGISTSKNKMVYHNWQADFTLVWFEDVNQEINNHKEYNARLEAKRVEC